MPSRIPEASEGKASRADVLATLINNRLALADGWLDFETFMQLALHEPGLGYYASGMTPVGQHGDFTTAAESGSLFSRTLARFAKACLADGDCILELGGGSGKLLADLLVELELLGSQPKCLALEISPGLRDTQRATLARYNLANRVEWLSALPSDFHGLILANEVLDSLPCKVLVKRGSQWRVRGVTGDANNLHWTDGPVASAADHERLANLDLPEGYQLEINWQAEALVTTLATQLSAGVILLIDYGFTKQELYHPQRHSGTLMSHRTQQANIDVLANPGLQDITAHVDFTALAAAGTAGGATVAGFTTQAAFLLDLGIINLAQQDADIINQTRTSQELQMLLMPHEMGDLFKVMALTCNRNDRLPGFGLRDKAAAVR